MKKLLCAFLYFAGLMSALSFPLIGIIELAGGFDGSHSTTKKMLLSAGCFLIAWAASKLARITAQIVKSIDAEEEALRLETQLPVSRPPAEMAKRSPSVLASIGRGIGFLVLIAGWWWLRPLSPEEEYRRNPNAVTFSRLSSQQRHTEFAAAKNALLLAIEHSSIPTTRKDELESSVNQSNVTNEQKALLQSQPKVSNAFRRYLLCDPAETSRALREHLERNQNLKATPAVR